jgi:hypothetical protein
MESMKNRGQLEEIPTADRPDREARFTPSSFGGAGAVGRRYG